jgi:hypothetical protein
MTRVIRYTTAIALLLLLLTSVVGAAEPGFTVGYGDCDHNNICVDITATTDGARAWYYVIDQTTGAFLIEPIVVALPVGAIVINAQATKATLTLAGIHLTWTSTGSLSITEDSDVIQTYFGVTSRTSWRRISNRAQVKGTVEGYAVDSVLLTPPGATQPPLGPGTLARFWQREK